jgi:hypothetical protein
MDETQTETSVRIKNTSPPKTRMENPSTESTFIAADLLLEKEKNHNKADNWNKLDKTEKIQKLHSFAEKYGKTQNLPIKEVKSLKMFFIECLEKAKLAKTKDVNYDKEKREIISIPSLFFNTSSRNFTLKIMDNKRISTLKSLTPKRISEKNTIAQQECSPNNNVITNEL